MDRGGIPKNKTMITVKWTYENRDSVTVAGATNSDDAFEAAESFLMSIDDDKVYYETDWQPGKEHEANADGSHTFRVKAYDK